MLEAVSGGQVAAVASELVLLELLVASLKKAAPDVADEIEMTLSHFPNLQLESVTREVLLRVAKIRAEYGLRTPDAIVIGTAIASRASVVVTNDDAWRKVRGLKVMLLSDSRN